MINYFFKILKYFRSKSILIYYDHFLIPSIKNDLRNKNIIKSSVQIKHTFSSFIILDSEFIFKFSKNKLWNAEIEYCTTNKILDEYPELVTYLPEMELFKYKSKFYLKSKKYNLIKKEDVVSTSIHLYKIFSKCDNDLNNKNILTNEISEGLYIFKKHLPKTDIEKVKRNLQIRIPFKQINIGFCHGDFHLENIMIDNKGNYKIIDLDCVSLKGIQYFDAFYFLLEYEFYLNKIFWLTTILNLLDNKIPQYFKAYLIDCNIDYSKEKLILFFFHRIGQEALKYNTYYNFNLLEPIFNKINFILHD